MTHMKKVLRLFLVSMLLVHLLSGVVLAGTVDKVRDKTDEPGKDLFFESKVIGKGLSETQSHLFRRYELKKTTKDFNVVELRTGLLKSSPQVAFNLFPGKRVVLTRDRIEEHKDNYSWYGASADGKASAILVVDGNEVDGNLRWEHEFYNIRSLGNGVHLVILIDQSRFKPEHGPEWTLIEQEAALKAPPWWLMRERREKISTPLKISHTNAVTHYIGVVVAYTPAADSEVSNIDNHIQLAIDETNQSYSNSQVNPRVSLKHKYETSYTESSSIFTDKNRFKNTSDGYMDEIHGKLNTYGGDVAVLMCTEDASYCGVADTILVDDETESFCVVNQDCATGYYSFAHEIGHLQGARHDTDNDSSTTPFAYGHGYHKSDLIWHFRTIMSYSCGGLACSRVQYWSNPNVTKTFLFWTTPLGTASTEHNARVLNETAAFFSSLRTRAYYGDSQIFLQAPGNSSNKATSKVYISAGDLAISNTAKLVCTGHNEDRDGYARVMRVEVNGNTYTTISWINDGQTVSNTYSIPLSALNSGVNTFKAYIHWSNDDYDRGHWVTLTLRLEGNIW